MTAESLLGQSQDAANNIKGHFKTKQSK